MILPFRLSWLHLGGSLAPSGHNGQSDTGRAIDVPMGRASLRPPQVTEFEIILNYLVRDQITGLGHRGSVIGGASSFDLVRPWFDKKVRPGVTLPKDALFEAPPRCQRPKPPCSRRASLARDLWRRVAQCRRTMPTLPGSSRPSPTNGTRRTRPGPTAAPAPKTNLARGPHLRSTSLGDNLELSMFWLAGRGGQYFRTSRLLSRRDIAPPNQHLVLFWGLWVPQRATVR